MPATACRPVKSGLRFNLILFLLILWFSVYCISCGNESSSAGENQDDDAQETEEQTNDDAPFDDGNSDSSVEYAMSVIRHGITWYFDQEYETGRFANGDYWVVGPVSINFISPECTLVEGMVVNGSMVDPKPSDFQDDGERNQGYGETVPNYNPAYNAALPNGSALSDQNPLIIQPGSCIVSSISTPGAGNGPHPNTAFSYDNHLKTCAVLTVLDSAPPDGSFRPSYCSYPKVVTYNESDINYDLLTELSITSEILNALLNDSDITVKGQPLTAADALDNVAAHFERTWLDYIPLSNGRPYHPLDNMPEYGENIGNFVGLAAIMLHLEFTHEQKRELLINFIQYGIDLYGVCRAETGNVTWPGGGGQSSGRKWPVLFAGIMLADTDGMMAIGDKSGDYARTNGEFSSTSRVGPTLPDDYIHFGEDDQTFYVTQEEIEAHAAYYHNQNPEYEPPNGEQVVDEADYNPPPEYWSYYNTDGQRFYPYRSRDLNMPEFGLCHWAFPNGPMRYDTRNWMAPYRANASRAWSGFVLAALIMNAKDLWNHDALFDYMDRYVELQAQRTNGLNPHGAWVVRTVWEEYREDY